MVQTALDTQTATIYTNLQQAAPYRLDYDMQIRVLIATEARYHRKPAWLSIHLNRRSTAAAHKKAYNTSADTDTALNKLV